MLEHPDIVWAGGGVGRQLVILCQKYGDIDYCIRQRKNWEPTPNSFSRTSENWEMGTIIGYLAQQARREFRRLMSYTYCFSFISRLESLLVYLDHSIERGKLNAKMYTMID